MKQSAQKRIIIWSVVSVLLVAILFSSFIFIADEVYIPSIDGILYNYKYEDYEFTSNDLTYYEDELLALKVNLINGKVIFKESSDEYVKISQYNSSTNDEADELELYCRYADDERLLTICGSDESYWLEDQDYSSEDLLSLIGSSFYDSPSKTIIVEVPEYSCLQEIYINTASAEIKLDNIGTDYLTINSYSGNVTLNEVNSPYNISINNVSGNINLNKTESEDLTINNLSGKVDINAEVNYLTLNSVSGDLNFSTEFTDIYSITINTLSSNTKIALPAENKVTVYSSSISGKVNIDGFKGANIIKNSDSDEYYIYDEDYDDSITQIEFDSVSGSITLEPTESDQAKQEKAEQNTSEQTTTAPSATKETTAAASASSESTTYPTEKTTKGSN